MDGYTTTHIAKLGIKRERLKVWLGEKWITPSIQAASGTGTINRFSKEDLYLIAVFDHLLQVGLSREDSAKRIKSLKMAVRHYNYKFCGILRAHGGDVKHPDKKAMGLQPGLSTVSVGDTPSEILRQDFMDLISDHSASVIVFNLQAIKDFVDSLIP